MRRQGDAITILIADAQPLFADALVEALSCSPGISPVDVRPHDGQAAVAAVDLHEPDVVLLDYWLGGEEVTSTIRTRRPGCKVILLTSFPSVSQIQNALSEGAVGFLTKAITVDELAEAVYRAQGGSELVFGEDLARLVDRLQHRDHQSADGARWIDELTAKERQVLALLTIGHTVEDVARHLSISVGTARNHVHRILKKTRTTSAIEAIAMARHYGFVRR